VGQCLTIYHGFCQTAWTKLARLVGVDMRLVAASGCGCLGCAGGNGRGDVVSGMRADDAAAWVEVEVVVEATGRRRRDGGGDCRQV
jgi:hypothetical protein